MTFKNENNNNNNECQNPGTANTKNNNNRPTTTTIITKFTIHRYQINGYGLITTTISIKDIAIKERFRKDFGDIGLLADNIRKVGLLVTVTVTYNPITKKYVLIDG